MAYTRSKRTRIKRTRGRRTRRTRSYKKGGQFSTPPRGANGVRSSAAPGQYGQPQQQYGQPQQQPYSPVQGNNLMNQFDAARTPSYLSGRYNNSGQFSPSSVAYPGYN